MGRRRRALRGPGAAARGRGAGAAARARPAGAADGAGLPRGVRRGGAAALAGRAVPRSRAKASGCRAWRRPTAGWSACCRSGRRRRWRRSTSTRRSSRARSGRALPTYDGRTGYQPVVALWAEQDVVLADEFRDGNVPAGTGNRRVVEQALAALPAGRRGDPRARRQRALRARPAALAGRGAGIGYAISADHEPRAGGGDPRPARGGLADRARGRRRDPALGRGGVRAERRRGRQGPAGAAALSGAPDQPRSRAGCSPTAARSSTSPSSPTCPTRTAAAGST